MAVEVNRLEELRKSIKEKEDNIDELLKKVREGDASLRYWLDKIEQVKKYKGIQVRTKTFFDENGKIITTVVDE